MEIVKRDNLVETLEFMIKIAKEMPEEMYFHVNVEFAGIDEKFQKVSHELGTARQVKLQEEYEASLKKTQEEIDKQNEKKDVFENPDKGKI